MLSTDELEIAIKDEPQDDVKQEISNICDVLGGLVGSQHSVQCTDEVLEGLFNSAQPSLMPKSDCQSSAKTATSSTTAAASLDFDLKLEPQHEEDDSEDTVTADSDVNSDREPETVSDSDSNHSLGHLSDILDLSNNPDVVSRYLQSSDRRNNRRQDNHIQPTANSSRSRTKRAELATFTVISKPQTAYSSSTKRAELPTFTVISKQQTSYSSSTKRAELPAIIVMHYKQQTACSSSTNRAELPAVIAMQDKQQTAYSSSTKCAELPAVIAMQDKLQTSYSSATKHAVLPTVIAMQDKQQTAYSSSTNRAELPAIIAMQDEQQTTNSSTSESAGKKLSRKKFISEVLADLSVTCISETDDASSNISDIASAADAEDNMSVFMSCTSDLLYNPSPAHVDDNGIDTETPDVAEPYTMVLLDEAIKSERNDVCAVVSDESEETGGESEQAKTLKPKVGNVKQKEWACSFCGKISSCQRDWRQHRMKHLGIRPYACDQCDLSFTTSHALVKHKALHDLSTELAFPCTYCARCFRTKLHLARHTLAMHEGGAERRFGCTVCQKRFMEQRHLDMHMRVHTNEMPHQCNICGRRFKWTGHFYRHMHQHSGIRPFECADCGKRFTDKVNLKFHSRVHSSVEDWFNCDVCGKRLRHEFNFRRHVAGHSEERKYGPCDTCGQRFKRPEHLTRHRKEVHGNERPYICPCCFFAFVCAGRLRRHIRQVHESTKPPRVRLPRQKRPRKPSPPRIHKALCTRCGNLLRTKWHLRRHLLHCNGLHLIRNKSTHSSLRDFAIRLHRLPQLEAMVLTDCPSTDARELIIPEIVKREIKAEKPVRAEKAATKPSRRARPKMSVLSMLQDCVEPNHCETGVELK